MIGGKTHSTLNHQPSHQRRKVGRSVALDCPAAAFLSKTMAKEELEEYKELSAPKEAKEDGEEQKEKHVETDEAKEPEEGIVKEQGAAADTKKQEDPSQLPPPMQGEYYGAQYPPYSPYPPPPGYYWPHPHRPPPEEGADKGNGVVSPEGKEFPPSNMPPWGMQYPPYGYPPQPYQPMPPLYPPTSPYYQHPNAPRPYCPPGGGGGSWPPSGPYDGAPPPYQDPYQQPYNMAPEQDKPTRASTKEYSKVAYEEIPIADGGESKTSLTFYVKSKATLPVDQAERRARKNSQSRARAAKLKERVKEIQEKPEHERTEEEKDVLSQFELRRKRKNDRSRERAIECKRELERILSKPENKRTQLETQFLEVKLGAKQAKNEGDRRRRQRLKEAKRKSSMDGAYMQNMQPQGHRGVPLPEQTSV